jgi:hypothetical protein
LLHLLDFILLFSPPETLVVQRSSSTLFWPLLSQARARLGYHGRHPFTKKP